MAIETKDTLYWVVMVAVLLLLGCLFAAPAQTQNGTLIHFEIENSTLYFFDCPPSQIGMNPNKLDLPAAYPPAGFMPAYAIGDIVSVNGMSVKGTAFETIHAASPSFSPNPAPGAPITDVAVTGTIQWDLDFRYPDGTRIGTIHVDGIAGGAAVPGAPAGLTGAYTVTGGTGPFLGARGYFQPIQDPTLGERKASGCEDPSMRRVNAGGRGKRHPILYLIPMERPEIVIASGGPAVFHSDFTPVIAARPAKAGEVLIVKASGLGATRPGVDLGQPFPLDTLQDVNSPLDVTVNGQLAEVINKIGWPGFVNTYRVDFRVPDGIAGATAAIQLTAAWIAGASVSIPVQ